MENNFLAQHFEKDRDRLRAVAYRMLGSLSEAEDAVQEAWIRLSRSDAAEIDNLGGWLTSVVSRVCLDHLRTRKRRGEEPLEGESERSLPPPTHAINPEQEAVLADSVGLALLVVLDRLSPAERVAFVLHDLFGNSFDEIGEMLGRSSAAVRQLASRARRRVQGEDHSETHRFAARSKVAKSFLAALRAGDIEGLIAVLDPDVVVHVDASSAAVGREVEIRGARTWAQGAVTYAKAAGAIRVCLIDGEVGLMLAPRGRLTRVVRFTWKNDIITRVDIVGESAVLAATGLGVIEEK